MFQSKEQDKTSEKELNLKEINNLCDKEFKVMVIKMLAKLRRMDEHSENLNKETENIFKKSKCSYLHVSEFLEKASLPSNKWYHPAVILTPVISTPLFSPELGSVSAKKQPR